jgi:hypothetical protein
VTTSRTNAARGRGIFLHALPRPSSLSKPYCCPEKRQSTLCVHLCLMR